MLALNHIYIIPFLMFAAIGLGPDSRFCPIIFRPSNTSAKYITNHQASEHILKRFTTQIYNYEYCGTLYYGTRTRNGDQERSGILYLPEGLWTFFWFVSARAPVRDASVYTGDQIVPQLPRTFIFIPAW